MTKQQFYREIESILEMPSQSIRGHETLADIGRWDSLATMGFIAMADQKLGASLPPGVLSSCQTIEDLARLLGPHLEA